MQDKRLSAPAGGLTDLERLRMLLMTNSNGLPAYVLDVCYNTNVMCGLRAALVGTVAALAAVPAYANVFVPNSPFIVLDNNTPGTAPPQTVFLNAPTEQFVATTGGGFGLNRK